MKRKSKGALGHHQGTFHATGAEPLPTLLRYLGRSSRSCTVAQQTNNFSQSRKPLENSRHSFPTALPLHCLSSMSPWSSKSTLSSSGSFYCFLFCCCCFFSCLFCFVFPAEAQVLREMPKATRLTGQHENVAQVHSARVWSLGH